MAQINYHLIIPQATDEEVSTFQGFNSQLLSKEFELLLIALCCAPNDTAELFMKHGELIKHRTDGPGKSAGAIGIEAAKKYPKHFDYPLNVFLCLPQQLDDVSQIAKNLSYPPLVVSTTSQNGAFNIKNTKEFNSHTLDKAILSKLKKITAGTPSAEQLKSKTPRKKYKKFLSPPSRHSNITLANEVTGLSLGYRLTSGKVIDPRKPENYFNAVIESTSALISILDPDSRNKNNIILFAPSIYSYLYDFNQNGWNQILRKIKTKWHRSFIKDGVFRNKHYSGFTLDSDNINTEKELPHKDPLVKAIITIRQRELRLTALAIGCLASLESKAALRLPNSINLHQGQLKLIEQSFNNGDPKARTLAQAKFIEMSNELKKEIGEDLINLILNKSDSCTICCDTPIEWAYLGSLPLMISHEVTKLPMTPGNMLLQYSAPGRTSLITQSSLQKILVIRSFAEGDKIRNIFKDVAKSFNFTEKMNFIFSDVFDIEGVIKELNNFSGSIVIFDCHGQHDGMVGQGWLNIGNEKLNTWELAYKARIPPIVLLSACSTPPINGSHVSVANGLMRSGALSVIGTYLPVNAIDSAAFISRILLRIDILLPILKKNGVNSLTWRDFLAAFFKMSYATDILQHFLRRSNITAEKYHDFHLAANIEINTYKTDWYENLINSVAQASELTPDACLKIIMTETPLTETMLYCQIGRSDLIYIDLTAD